MQNLVSIYYHPPLHPSRGDLPKGMPSAKDILEYLASISYSDPEGRGIEPLNY